MMRDEQAATRRTEAATSEGVVMLGGSALMISVTLSLRMSMLCLQMRNP